MLAACGEESGVAVPSGEAASTETASATAMEKWSRSCVLCHVAGEGGAPRIGSPEDWTERVARGEDSMVRHAIEGYNNMPPLGYCMDCEELDFRELTRYMASASAEPAEQETASP